MWRWTWLDDLFRDIHLGVRQFRRAPKYALMVTIVLAGGAGVALGVVHLANAAYFQLLGIVSVCIVALLGAFLPASRALRVNPADTLRHD